MREVQCVSSPSFCTVNSQTTHLTFEQASISFSAQCTSPDNPVGTSTISVANKPAINMHDFSTTVATEPHLLDANAFPAYGTHLLPSEPNGTWRAQAKYLFKNSNGSPQTFCKVMEQHTRELGMLYLLTKVEQVAEDRKDDFNDWLNRAFANLDLVELHGRVQRLVPTMSTPSLRQLDKAIDMVSGIAQTLRRGHPESDLLNSHMIDKWSFARDMCHLAEHALVDQGILTEGPSTCRKHQKVLYDIQFSLMNTFIRVTELSKDVPLHHAKPQWVADRVKKVWRLELRIGRVSIEVGPATDSSLVELDSIETGFEISEYCGRVLEFDLDHQNPDQIVDDDWQLL